jgi:hypothetical protein
MIIDQMTLKTDNGAIVGNWSMGSNFTVEGGSSPVGINLAPNLLYWETGVPIYLSVSTNGEKHYHRNFL